MVRARAVFDVPVLDVTPHGKQIANPTWQVRRPEFDQILLDAAIMAGARHYCADDYGVIREDRRVAGLKAKIHHGAMKEVRSRFVADASGFSTVLSKRGALGKRNVQTSDKQIAFYAYLEGVKRDAKPDEGNTVIYYSLYFHWAWQIPVSDTMASIGIVVPQQTYRDTGLSAEDFFDAQLQLRHPELASRTTCALRQTEVRRRANFSYMIEDFAGPGFITIGDSHRFLVPIFFFSVWMGMKEAELADKAISETLADPDCEKTSLERYIAISNRGQSVETTILHTFWNHSFVFLKLAHFTHLAEIARLFAGQVFHPEDDDMKVVRLMRGGLDKSSAGTEERQYANH